MTEPYAEDPGRHASFWPLVGLAFLLGAAFRLYLLPDQILLNDEWHGMSIVSGKSWQLLLTHFNRRANSIPMNLYRFFLLQTVGWSEMLMRIPPLAAGLAGLAVFPALVRRVFGSRVAVVFAFLLAMSPFLVLYSRISRAYGVVVFLAVIAFMALYFWSETGKRNYAVLYIASGAGAVFFHLTPVMTVFAPLGLLFLLKLFARGGSVGGVKARIVPRASSIAIVGGILLVLSLMLVLPAFLQNKWWLEVTGDGDRVALYTLAGFASLASGTANPALCLIFWCFFAIGQISMLRRKPIFGMASLVVLILYFAGLLAARWETLNLPLEFTRFCISLLPMIFIAVALGIDSATGFFCVRTGVKEVARIPVSIPVFVLFLGGLLAASPLFSTYRTPNNFTNHSAFNESYEPLQWEHSYASGVLPGFRMSRKDVPPFYEELASREDVEAIIEYPMFIGDNYNLYYYYQHFHKKEIIIGYLSVIKMNNWPYGDYVYGDMFADHVLSRVAKSEAYRFRNMVDMMNTAALASTSASYLVLHKNPYAEIVGPLAESGGSSHDYQPVLLLRSLYVEAFGAPVHEDACLVVFRLPGR